MQNRISANYLNREDKTNRTIVNVGGALIQTADVFTHNVEFKSANDREQELGCTQVAVTESPVTLVPTGSSIVTDGLEELIYYCGSIVKESNRQGVDGAKTFVVKGCKMFAAL